MASKVKSLDIAEIASKVLILPTETRPKKPSKRLLLEIKGFVTDFSKTKERANRVIELGIKEGFTDSEIGKLVRQAMKKLAILK